MKTGNFFASILVASAPCNSRRPYLSCIRTWRVCKSEKLNMAAQPPVQAIVFQLGLQKFKASLSDKEKREFGVTTLEDLKVTIETIQQKQRSERKLRAMSKLGRFLEGMQEYDKIVAVFLNTSEILAFVWVRTHQQDLQLFF